MVSSRERRFAAGWLAFALVSALAPAVARGQGVKGRWLGQDRHDYCGAIGNEVAPNGVQDVHIALAGLPPRREVTFASVTGHGADEWRFGGERNQFAAVFQRKPGGTTADLFFEPLRVETGREFCVKLRFDDGRELDVFLAGGKADPNLRMPGTGVSAAWVGQVREDWAGPGPSVGPDGFQDVEIRLEKLAGKESPVSVVVESAPSRWAFGTNPQGFANAEFEPDPKTPNAGRLLFQPDRDLAGRKLTVTVTYGNGKSDVATVAATRCEPKRAMPKVTLPRLEPLAAKVRWIGQDGRDMIGGGEVHVALSGLPPRRKVAGAVLSDPVRGVWAFHEAGRAPVDAEPYTDRLTFQAGPSPGTADLFFAPVRDTSGSPMVLRLVFEDGSSGVVRFEGGPADVAKRAPKPAAAEAVAKPGDDLQALVNANGTVRLAKGDHRLSRPLVLDRPVTIEGEPGAAVVFAQGAGEPPWTAAIKVHRGGTTFRGFAVRFEGPVRWKADVSWGPAVVGTTDNLDGIPDHPIPHLVFENLDLEGPPSAILQPWEETPKLLRLLNATGGVVRKNRFRGGVVELFGGPWAVEENTFRGTPPGTFTPVAVAVHEPHDVVVRRNAAKPDGPSGKTWRFLLFRNRGGLDRVEDNVIEGVGPRDDDTIPAANAPEIVLTESYHLRFEGAPAAVSEDRRLVAVRALRGEPPRTGDVVSVVSGPSAGAWRRVAQRVTPTAYLLDEPLPKEADVIVVSPGFIGQRYERNRVDARGGRAAAGFVLAGNHFGTVVRENTVEGAGDAFQVMAYPSESPGIWGWSHAPFLGVVFEGNAVVDSERGASFGVLHVPASKSNRGRVYMTLDLKGNTVRWSKAFLDGLSGRPEKAPFAGLRLGFAPSLDPGELRVEASGNRLDAPPGAAAGTSLRVEAARVNGRDEAKKATALPGVSGDSARR